jgi:hypothetical protein
MKNNRKGKALCPPKDIDGLPRKLILSESGKRLEEEADRDIKEGKVRTCECMDEIEKYLAE